MNYNKYIDDTLLKQDATSSQIIVLCKEAKEYSFKSVCVNPDFVSLAKNELKDSDVLVCTVIGFPLGANTTATKVFETKDALNNGADEIDMVINVSKVKDNDNEYVKEEISKIKEVCGNHTLKVILETCYLTKEEIIKASEISKAAGADFVKTSTGFGTGGAKASDVKIMRETVGKDLGVKASGGIHNKNEMEEMIEAGANRIGASAGVKIMEEYENE